MLYAKHPNKHNNQQFDVKTILQNKQTNKQNNPVHAKLGVT